MRSLFLYLVLIFGFPAQLFAQEIHEHQNWGQGPIELSNHFPLALHLSPPPRSTEVLAPGETILRQSVAWSNTFVRERVYNIDAESRTFQLQARRGLSEGLEIEGLLPLIWRGGGVLDSSIDAWHRFWGFPRGRREDVPHDQYVMSGKNNDGSGFNFSREGTELGDLQLGARYKLSDGSETLPAWSLSSRIQLPTGASTYGHDGVDLNIGTVVSKQVLDSTFVYLGGDYVFFTDEETQGLHYQQNQFSGFLAGEYALTDAFSFLTTVSIHSKMLDQIEHYPNYGVYLDLGLKWQALTKLNCEFLIRENLGPSDSTTDFTLFFGASLKL